MAIFHLSAKAPVARSAGQSATAAAAYRSGALIFDERTAEIHDYSRKRGVLSSALLVPGGARLADRAAFWNRVESHHRRGDAVLAREIVVALPAELDASQRTALAEAFSEEIANRFGVAVDVNVHAPSRHGDQRNHHAHLLQSACLVGQDGELGKKSILLDPIHCARAKIDDAVHWLRPRWAALVNAALAEAGFSDRVDHRSNLAQGCARLPTIHEGVGDGAAARKRSNAVRRKANADADMIDVEVAALLRERAILESTAKIMAAAALAQADADVAVRPFSDNRDTTGAVDGMNDLAAFVGTRASPVRAQVDHGLVAQQRFARLQTQFVDLTVRRAEALGKSSLLAETLTQAVAAHVVREAQAGLASIRRRAQAARQTAQKASAGIKALRWWQPWWQRSAMTQQHERAERRAQRLALELRDCELDAKAQVRESVQSEQRQLTAMLRDLDLELGHIGSMIEQFNKGTAKISRPMNGPMAADQMPVDGGGNMRRR